MKKFLLLQFVFLLTQTSLAATHPVNNEAIFCHTPRFAKSFLIRDKDVIFIKKKDLKSKRKIASISKSRTSNGITGFRKELVFEGNHYKINIERVKKFSDLDDYLSIRSPKGHEITYSLTCKNI